MQSKPLLLLRTILIKEILHGVTALNEMYLTFLTRPRALVSGEGFPSADCPEDGITEEPKGESINNAMNDLSWTGNRLPCIICVAPSWTFQSTGTTISATLNFIASCAVSEPRDQRVLCCLSKVLLH